MCKHKHIGSFSSCAINKKSRSIKMDEFDVENVSTMFELLDEIARHSDDDVLYLSFRIDFDKNKLANIKAQIYKQYLLERVALSGLIAIKECQLKRESGTGTYNANSFLLKITLQNHYNDDINPADSFSD